jgi:hypothetical protein
VAPAYGRRGAGADARRAAHSGLHRLKCESSVEMARYNFPERGDNPVESHFMWIAKGKIANVRFETRLTRMAAGYRSRRGYSLGREAEMKARTLGHVCGCPYASPVGFDDRTAD